jgi:hypothetical protein
MACTAAILAFFVRSQVTPVAKLTNEAGIARYDWVILLIAVMVLFILLIVADVIKIT